MEIHNSLVCWISAKRGLQDPVVKNLQSQLENAMNMIKTLQTQQKVATPPPGGPTKAKTPPSAAQGKSPGTSTATPSTASKADLKA